VIPLPTSTEAGLNYDGPFSTYRECHAFLLGLHAGLDDEGGAVIAVARGDRDAETKAEREVRKEPWYASGGVLVARGYRRVR
jgi:hypothetical protein